MNFVLINSPWCKLGNTTCRLEVKCTINIVIGLPPDPASGKQLDYFKGFGGVKYTSAPVIRGDNHVTPPEQITPAFQELWQGIVKAITTIAPIAGVAR